MKLINPSPALHNEDLAPAANRHWGAFSIFNVWTSDVHSLYGYFLAASLFLLCGNFFNFAFAIPALAEKNPCQPIRAACQAAGFVQGGGKTGAGLAKDCVEPLVAGTPQSGKASKPLPSVDPTALAACRMSKSADAGATAPATVPEAPPAPKPGNWPNIVMVLVDDYALNLMKHDMPNLAAMQKDGMTFENYFVTDSLCCPSRSSIFTGMMPHNTQVFTNSPPFGGFGAFMAHDDVSHTFAIALHAAGYQTAMMGKYLNGYEPDKHGAPKGWSEWDVAGNGYGEFNYKVNEDGKVVAYGSDPASYGVDVLAGLGDAFIRKAAKKPFFIEIATFAPHAPYTPAPRDADKFPGLTYDRTAAFAARPNASAPGWLQEIKPLTPANIALIDKSFRLRVQADQSVDLMIGKLRATLAELGLTQNTYVVFTSDNGYHMGEWSLRPGKMSPFDTDIHVPLVIVGPGVAAGSQSSELAENIDLAPTYTELAGAGTGPTTPDGHSLAALLHAKPDAAAPAWRRSVLIEHRHPTKDPTDPDIQEPPSGNPPSYEAMRTQDALYVEYDDTAHEVGYYDLKVDPLELNNIASATPQAKLKKLHDILAAAGACKGAAACWAAQSAVP